MLDGAGDVCIFLGIEAIKLTTKTINAMITYDQYLRFKGKTAIELINDTDVLLSDVSCAQVEAECKRIAQIEATEKSYGKQIKGAGPKNYKETAKWIDRKMEAQEVAHYEG